MDHFFSPPPKSVGTRLEMCLFRYIIANTSAIKFVSVFLTHCALIHTLSDPTECQDGVTNNCTQNCTRTFSNGTSSYECGCSEGYRLNLDNATCDGK